MDSDPSIGLLLLGFRLLISPFTVNFTVRISRVHWTFAQQQCVRYLLTIACEEQMQLSIVTIMTAAAAVPASSYSMSQTAKIRGV